MKWWTLLTVLALLLCGCAGECVRECKHAALEGCDDNTKCFREVMLNCTQVCKGESAAVSITSESNQEKIDEEPQPEPPLDPKPEQPKTDDRQAWPPQ